MFCAVCYRELSVLLPASDLIYIALTLVFTEASSLSCRPMLKDAKKAGVTHVVLDVERDKIFTVLKQAQQIGMMTSYHNYFITSLVSTAMPT